MPGHLRASSKKHAKQADQIEKTVKLAGKYMNQSNELTKLFNLVAPNATYQRRRGLPFPKRNVPRLTQRKKPVANKASSLYLTQKQQRKQARKLGLLRKSNLE
jgi:hypothetical protein